MKSTLFYKCMLSLFVTLLLLNFIQGNFSSKTAMADTLSETIGKFQISAWSSQSGPRSHHSGYYVIDTTTGKVVDSHSEVHSVKE